MKCLARCLNVELSASAQSPLDRRKLLDILNAKMRRPARRSKAHISSLCAKKVRKTLENYFNGSCFREKFQFC